ncbi:GNAT family N-acetyltransferase [Sinomonas terrae]|uniref:GNAT family N-acetyltransferase n=1 Tax=Sinomonas terrae TaxID=2908838 RepID=A0ABS9U4D9_9MICC|nr:GNAT family protein [Sinomonas terrae]MCH6471553.1 GNAT family N-acetyltransferase [Sinomonas terrae]
MEPLETIWPVFGLRLTTPRLVLRPIQDGDIPAFVEAAASGIYETRDGHIPFPTDWPNVPDMGPNSARWIWEHRIQANPGSWVIMFGVSTRDGDFLGTQDVASKDFPSLRTISTGSWLRRSAQGQGLGKEMRAAILLWAFDHLGADVAMTSAYDWNSSSIGVSTGLGYEPNGETRTMTSTGTVEREVRFRLSKERFRRPDWELEVEGHAAAAAFLGVPSS